MIKFKEENKISQKDMIFFKSQLKATDKEYNIITEELENCTKISLSKDNVLSDRFLNEDNTLMLIFNSYKSIIINKSLLIELELIPRRAALKDMEGISLYDADLVLSDIKKSYLKATKKYFSELFDILLYDNIKPPARTEQLDVFDILSDNTDYCEFENSDFVECNNFFVGSKSKMIKKCQLENIYVNNVSFVLKINAFKYISTRLINIYLKGGTAYEEFIQQDAKTCLEGILSNNSCGYKFSDDFSFYLNKLAQRVRFFETSINLNKGLVFLQKSMDKKSIELLKRLHLLNTNCNVKYVYVGGDKVSTMPVMFGYKPLVKIINSNEFVELNEVGLAKYKDEYVIDLDIENLKNKKGGK